MVVFLCSSKQCPNLNGSKGNILYISASLQRSKCFDLSVCPSSIKLELKHQEMYFFTEIHSNVALKTIPVLFGGLRTNLDKISLGNFQTSEFYPTIFFVIAIQSITCLNSEKKLLSPGHFSYFVQRSS